MHSFSVPFLFLVPCVLLPKKFVAFYVAGVYKTDLESLK